MLKQGPAELILWAEELVTVVELHKEVLTGGGYAEDSFQKLISAKGEMHTHYFEQQEALKRRPEKTAERIIHYNAIWGSVVEIHEAAKRIFRNQPEILALFALPKVQHKREKKSTEPSFDVPDGALKEVAQ